MTIANDHQSSDAPPRVLLVEDDGELRLAIADYLRLRGLDIVEAESGIGYFQALRTGRFDVAVLDVNLPDISGLELARDLAGEHNCGIIVLTARSARQDRIEGYSAGADIYLTKPVDTEELFLAIQNLSRRLSRTSQPLGLERPESSLSWWLDLSRGLLIAPSGRSITLTGRELLLMQHIAEAQQGATVSRTDLITVLGYRTLPPESRSLDAVLRRLRQKAMAADITLPLHSIHSLGFRFTAPISIA
ncbi:response regulator transcription factor [Sphingomonas fennica]|uniref:DNA-binding response regulator n=1 Tax=Edaphosphingomonas fennica TaxID=114404 RepID=A0A2T4HUV1_9SPHN|nr:response regulator transcription factor [Sphingomonas fennica]PTD19571.1 DNA-binding response regulator [Sphingomonas fennica]